MVLVDWIVFLSLFQSTEAISSSHSTPTVPSIFRANAADAAILAFISTVLQLAAGFTVHIFGQCHLHADPSTHLFQVPC